MVKMATPEIMKAEDIELPDMNVKFNGVSFVSSGELLSVTFPKKYISKMGMPGALLVLCIIIIVTFLKIFL